MGKRTKAKSKTKSGIIFFLLLLLSGCANQLPPGGGEVDKIPPKIEEFYPPNGSINFTDDYISFDFSEYVDKQSFKEAVFISPQIEGELVYNWSGKSISIEFPKKLRENTTYVVTIGTDVADIHNHNKMTQSFSLTFSTGNEIDKRSIQGRVYDENPTGVMIYAYKINGDSLNPQTVKPDYITQTGKNGQFKLNGISSGKFRIFAVKDKFKDFFFQPKQDDIGIAGKDITFTNNDTTFEKVNFKLTKIDAETPRILKAIMTDEHHLYVEFTEALSQSSIISEKYYVFDSTLNKKLTLKNIYVKESKNKIVLINENKIDANSNLFFVVENIDDLKGNKTNKDVIILIYSNRTDTTKPKLVSTEPSIGNDISDYSGQDFKFYFSDHFDTTLAKDGIKFVNSENVNTPYQLEFFDNASFNIIPTNDLLPLRDYKIILDLSKFKNQNGSAADSNYIYNFTTINGLNFSGVTGQVKNISTEYPVYVILEGIDKSKKKYKQQLNKDSKFIFTRVVSGKYKLWCFIDKDINGEYSFGRAFPFQPAEEFSYLKSKLELRPRWMQTDVVIEF